MYSVKIGSGRGRHLDSSPSRRARTPRASTPTRSCTTLRSPLTTWRSSTRLIAGRKVRSAGTRWMRASHIKFHFPLGICPGRLYSVSLPCHLEVREGTMIRKERHSVPSAELPCTYHVHIPLLQLYTYAHTHQCGLPHGARTSKLSLEFREEARIRMSSNALYKWIWIWTTDDTGVILCDM